MFGQVLETSCAVTLSSTVSGLSSVTRLCNLLDFGQFFESLCQQLICPNLQHSQAIFVKVLKSIIFLLKLIWATFIDIWRLFTGHTVSELPIYVHVIDFDGKIKQQNSQNYAQTFGKFVFLPTGFDISFNPKNTKLNLFL